MRRARNRARIAQIQLELATISRFGLADALAPYAHVLLAEQARIWGWEQCKDDLGTAVDRVLSARRTMMMSGTSSTNPTCRVLDQIAAYISFMRSEDTIPAHYDLDPTIDAMVTRRLG